MLDQLGDCPVKVYREELGAKLGKMPFYGQPRNYAGTHYFQQRN